MLTPVSIELEISSLILVWCFALWAYLQQVFKILFSHALLILTKSSKSKNQVVLERKTF